MNSSLKQFALVAGILLTAHTAHAQNANWTGSATPPNNTQFSNGQNWDSGAEPTATATIATTATVDLPGTATTLTGDLVVTTSTVVVNATTAGFTVQTLQVNGGGVLTLNIPTGGTFTIAANFPTSFIGGERDGTSGVLNLTGGGTLFLPAGTDDFGVGQGGNGTVNQTAGFFDDTTNLYIGGDSGVVGNSDATTPGNGTYFISGTSTLTADNIFIAPGSTTATGTSTGTFNISGGAIVTTTDLIMGSNLSNNPPSNPANPNGPIHNTTGVLSQSGGSLTVTELVVAANPGAVDTFALGGTGTFSATTMTVGSLAGASGTFTQSGGTSTITNLTVGASGAGVVNMQGGSLTIVDTGELAIGDQATSGGIFNQTGGAVTLVNTATLLVGESGAGTYILSGGTLTVGASGELAVGTGSGTGTFTLAGTGDLIAPSGVLVGGSSGTGVFNYAGGTIDPTTSIEILSNGTFNQDANYAPPAGNPLILGAGATYNLNSGTLTIGGDMTTVGFSGIFAFSSATFNFAGGTVLPTGTDWFDGLNGSVTGNSTIDTTTNNAILSGTLTGSGTLTVIGTNTLSIDTGGSGNSSAASWGVDVLGGTVSANASTFPSTGNILIGSSGTVIMADSGTNALAGAVSGAGAFTATFTATTDTLELTGPVALTGTTNLEGGGTLQTLNGTLSNVGGDGSLVVGGASGSGAVSLNGTNNYTGSTTIESGYALTASDIGGAGLVTNFGTIGSNATLSNTLNTPTLSIGGDFVSNGTILIRMNGINADQIQIAGSADVSGSTFTIINPGTTGTFTIVTTGSGVTANNIVQPTGNAFFHATVEPSGTNPADDLWLVATSNTSSQIPGLTLTPNEAAIAASLDALITNPSNLTQTQLQKRNAILNLIGPANASPSQIALDYAQFTPQSLQYAHVISYEQATFLVQKVDGFDNLLHHDFTGFDTSAINLTTPFFNSGLGRQMQSLLAFDPPSFHQSAPNGVNYYPEGDSGTPSSAAIETPSSPEPSSQIMSDSPTTAPMPMRTEPRTVTIRKPYSNFSAFVGGDGTIADLNQNSNQENAPATKASYSAVDAIAGISYRMTSNFSAGILFDYDHTDADTDGYGSKTKIDSYSPGVFATYGDKGFYVNGLFAYSRNNYNNVRVIPSAGGSATSSSDGNQYTAGLDAGYEFHPARDWSLTPAAGLTYTHVDIDSANESGSTLDNLNIDAQHDDSLRSRLGGSLGYVCHPAQLTLLPTFSAMWQHEFLDDTAPITSQLDGLPGPFTIHSVSEGRDSALISVGLTCELDNSMAVFFDCTADVNGNYNAENFVGGFRGSF